MLVWWIVLGVVVVIFWLIKSIGIVGPDEMAGWVFFGKVRKPCYSGPHFVPLFPHSSLKRITKKRLELDFAPRIVFSKAGEWKGRKYGIAILLIDAAVYVEFKEDFEAIKDAIARGVPTTEEELVQKLDSEMDAIFRIALGEVPWGKATEREGHEQIESIIKEELTKDGSFLKLGGFDIDKTAVRVRTVDFESKPLKEALATAEKQKLQAEGAISEAERLRRQTEVVSDIRKALVEDGKFNPANADAIAHDIYKVQVAADLSKEAKYEALKVIKFETTGGGGSLGGILGEGYTALQAIKGALQPPQSPQQSSGGHSPQQSQREGAEKSEEEKEEEEKYRKMAEEGMKEVERLRGRGRRPRGRR